MILGNCIPCSEAICAYLNCLHPRSAVCMEGHGHVHVVHQGKIIDPTYGQFFICTDNLPEILHGSLDEVRQFYKNHQHALVVNFNRNVDTIFDLLYVHTQPFDGELHPHYSIDTHLF